ncbi:hypothetical protein PS862_03905 [Pseudomonas fluorescens]|uniref:PIN domain-containing protein n=1 Tax=Pseudomonas fluorescens TaxID=294 RepID=A0A5E7MBK3_PSEFL|nr:hypothetical protein [Pseudomonas fluorescens]VVM60537.1 hypothetical protein PS639_01254 [Pseudomonas fluorescens]VVP21997.1 hypothetical protein PS862_03905 [Pseudomonas fluorescens]
MSQRILIIDTSVLCCWLQVPGKAEAGPVTDRWTHERISKLIALELERKSTLVLPLATLIETGNHIAQAPTDRFECATALAGYLREAANATSPWVAFTEQTVLWQPENLLALANAWPQLAAQKLTIGDTTIKDVAEYYAKAGYTVEILTGDAGLKAHEPAQPVSIPRRRR